MLSEYFDLEYVPDHSVLCKKNASRRWLTLWKRFFSYVLDRLPGRTVVIATDASGFSGRKQSWRETDHAVKANQDWVKIHAAIEANDAGQRLAEAWGQKPDELVRHSSEEPKKALMPKERKTF